jgi:hypothetical protein
LLGENPRTVRIAYCVPWMIRSTEIDGTVFYIGRSGWVTKQIIGIRWEVSLANPYVIGKHGDRDQCVELFKTELRRRIAARELDTLQALQRIGRVARASGHVTMICHCSLEQACHARVVGRTLATGLEKLGYRVAFPQLA